MNNKKLKKLLDDRLNEDSLFPYVKVKSVDDYFLLPRSERSKWGIYLKPRSLPLGKTSWGIDFGNGEKGWTEWDEMIRKEYPIQWFFREYLFSIDNPVYYFVWKICHKIRDWKYNIKHLIKPCHPRMRKVYPRHEWRDLANVIPEINLAMILDFWHEEVSQGIVDWQSDDKHKDFYNWLKATVEWIEVDRVKLQEEIDKAMNEATFGDRKGKTFEELYGRQEELEKQMEDRENEIVYQMMKYRHYFWT